MSYYDGWRPYVPVAKRRAQAARKVQTLRKQGVRIEPVEIQGRKIAHTFWGQAWCSHLEGFGDYANRLPRGRTYVRNGSVCHLGIEGGRVEAMVSGSDIYDVCVEIAQLSHPKWEGIKKRCAGGIGSLLELLRGQFSKEIMAIVTDRTHGLFPQPGEIRFQCSCPDWAVMCKHVAAVLYGVGARLDQSPDLLFLLRGVNHEELIQVEPDVMAATAGRRGRRRRIAADDLADVFDIDLAGGDAEDREKEPAPAPSVRTQTGTSGPRRKRAKVTADVVEAPPETSLVPDSAEAVVALRNRLGITRSDLARLLGVTTASVSKWEGTQAKLRLHARTAKALADAAKLSKRQARIQLRLQR